MICNPAYIHIQLQYFTQNLETKLSLQTPFPTPTGYVFFLLLQITQAVSPDQKLLFLI